MKGRKRIKKLKKPKKQKPAVPPGRNALFDAIGLGVYKACDKKAGRYAIDHIAIEPDGTCVGTNGFVVVAIEGVKDQDVADFPKVGEPKPPESTELVPADIAREAIKNLPRSSAKPILTNALLTRSGKDGPEFTTTDLKRTRQVGAPKAEGTFPAWRDMFKRLPNHRRYCMSVAALEVILDVARGALSGEDKQHQILEMLVPEQDSAILIRARVKGGRRMLIMASEGREKDCEETPWEKTILDAE